MNEGFIWFCENILTWVAGIGILLILLLAIFMPIFCLLSSVDFSKKKNNFTDEIIRISRLKREPCPVCDSRPRILLQLKKKSGSDWTAQHCVRCPECKMFVFAKGADEAVKTWNKVAIKKRGGRGVCIYDSECEDFVLED